MAWSIIFDSPDKNNLWVPYDWKPDHEYLVYALGLHKTSELECHHFFTIDNTLTPGDQAYTHRGYDSYFFMEHGANKGFRSVGFNSDSPIVRILERPLAIGTTSEDSENWERVPITPGPKVYYDWLDGYEYIAYTRTTASAHTWHAKKFVTCTYAFAAEALSDVDLGGGRSFHGNIWWGYLAFWRKTPGGQAGLDTQKFGSTVNPEVFALYRRKIRIVNKKEGKLGWEVVQDAGLQGIHVDRLAMDWPYDAEIVMNHTDPYGKWEMFSASLFTDKKMLNTSVLRSKWRWNGVLCNPGSSSCAIWFLMDWVHNRGYKSLSYDSKKYTPKVFQTYVRVYPSHQVVLPKPDPEPAVPCEDRCYVVDTVWQQIARVELYFINPPDWANRKYEYEWGGDLGKGDVELVGVEDGGRVAVIRLVRTLALEDKDGSVDFNIECKVIDVEYKTLGVTDTASAKITFELPCVTDRNNPDIMVEDIQILELNENRKIPVRVFLSEAYRGAEPLCVDWETRDGTAVSDMRVQALAYDTGGKPFITIIENADRRVYIDGGFPKYYNQHAGSWDTVEIHINTLKFTKNLINWLTKDSTKPNVVLLGDKGSQYQVEGNANTGFGAIFNRACNDMGIPLVVHTVDDLMLLDYESILDTARCVIYFSSRYTLDQVLPPVFVTTLADRNARGLGVAIISDHGDNAGTEGFFRGANDFLDPTFGVRMKGYIDRNGMNLQVNSFKPHVLWDGLTGRFASNVSEAYVDAVDQEPDYVADRGTVCFVSGEQEKLVEVEIVGDLVEEDNEYFDIMLSNNTWGTIVKNVGRVTITDDDAEPCGVSTSSGGFGVTETWHNLGSIAGTVTVSYQMLHQPDMMEIFYDGVIVATTGGFVMGSGTISFEYPGYVSGKPAKCLIRMTGQQSGTMWSYTMNCISEPEPPETPVVDGEGSGDGGGCLVYGTMISMADGSFKPVEQVVIGDAVRSIRVIGSPDSTLTGDDYMKWSSDILDVEFTESVVVNNDLDSYKEYYKITASGLIDLHITLEHPVLVKTSGKWKWIQPKDIAVGDIILHERHGELEITSCTLILESVKTANLNVENVDTYIANGLLVHNNENQKN
ncbi:MAG: Calx-beta domain-containing protein [Bacteroidales bacterium]